MRLRSVSLSMMLRKTRQALYRKVLVLPDWVKAALVLSMLIPAVWMVFGMAILAVVTK